MRQVCEHQKGGSRCDPAEGWHIEEWPDAGQVAVSDLFPRRDAARRMNRRSISATMPSIMTT
jgi:hypothetical protein